MYHRLPALRVSDASPGETSRDSHLRPCKNVHSDTGISSDQWGAGVREMQDVPDRIFRLRLTSASLT